MRPPSDKSDVPDAELSVLDAVHFAPDEATDDVARLTRDFLACHFDSAQPIKPRQE